MLTKTEKELTTEKTSEECCKNSSQTDKHHYPEKNRIEHCCGRHNHDHHNGCRRQGEQD